MVSLLTAIITASRVAEPRWRQALASSDRSGDRENHQAKTCQKYSTEEGSR